MITTNNNSDAGDKETRNNAESSTTEAESTNIQYKCDVCEYQSEKEITLNNPKNTKHLNLRKTKVILVFQLRKSLQSLNVRSGNTPVKLRRSLKDVKLKIM
jgi:hypothetical protein